MFFSRVFFSVCCYNVPCCVFFLLTQMFLTVYLSNSDKHFTELPITPETLCRDVVDMCKEPGEVDCYLAEMWRGSERVIGDSERIIEVLQRWGQQRAEVRFFMRHDRAPGHDTGEKESEREVNRTVVLSKVTESPHMDITLSELQEMASRQQQQINAQQQLLATKEQRLHFLKLQDQRQQQQQASEQEKLRLLRENAENQEAKLRRVRGLKGQVEQKRISNSKLVEEIEQMNGLFQQKQRELAVAVSRVEELSRQLDMLRGGKMDVPHEAGPSSSGELERLYKELQLRNKLNQEQSAKLQQQRENLNKRNVEMAAMDKRVAELRERLWKKKAALQQKENLPPSEGKSSQPTVPSRVAAVGPYIQTTPAPPVPPRQEILVKLAYPNGSATLPKPLPKPTTGTCFYEVPDPHSLPLTVYGKPVIPSSGGQQSLMQDSSHLEKTGGLDGDQVDQGNNMAPASSSVEGQEVERVPRPLSPTKLLPFLSNSHRLQSDADLEALRKRLHHAPRPLKKRGSITESEGPGGPNIQKLLYQKTTLAAMETTITPASTRPHEGHRDTTIPECEKEEEELTPPPLPPRSPILDDSTISSTVPKEPPLKEEQEVYGPAAPEPYVEEYPPYPPPPYPSMTDQEGPGEDSVNMKAPEVTGQVMLPPGKRTNLRKTDSERINHGMRVHFNPLALLLDSSLEGEYDLVQRIIYEVEDPSLPNDEGITALHNAVCAGHTEIVKFLVQFGVNANAADSDGWTPLHCAASCNNVQVCKFLVESGAAVYATTYSDMQTAADKCEEMEEGYAQCSQFLYGVQEKMGIMNRGVVYALWDYDAESPDELSFEEGDCLTVLRREDSEETEWWWARCADNEGYIPRNHLGLYPRIKPRQRSLA
uniref:Apoptosis-stimulating of p53 protein 2-like n=1 Tax=Sinocyclocheilus anshuiensis TaxID=1608454 RepID=A0A671TD14_9TELE